MILNSAGEAATLCARSKAFRNIWNAVFTHPIDHMLALIGQLQSKGIQTALCSNTNDVHWDFLRRKYPALEKADAQLLSFQLKRRKPDVDFWAAVCKKTACAMEQHLLVDDLEANRAAARAQRMHALDPNNSAEDIMALLKTEGWI